LPAAAAHAADPVSAPPVTSGGVMQEVRVEGSKENEFKADRANSAKYTELLVNTPQTITVIKKELIEQQGAVTLAEALRNTPGVGAFFLGENGATNTGDAIYMRGFDASSSIYVDGVRDMGSISRDIFNIEQIDIVKGPAGTDGGRGSPTGSVNLGSKQATMQDAYSGIVTAGSGKQKRATADLNKVVDYNSGTAFRLNLLAQDSGNPARDVVKNKRWAVAPTIGFGIGSPTRVSLSLLHVDQDNIPDGGVPTIGLPGYTTPGASKANPGDRRLYLNDAKPVDPSGFYGSTSDYDKVKADMATVRFEHDFSPSVKLQNMSRYGKTKQDYLLSAFRGNADNLVTDIPPTKTAPAILLPASQWTLKRPDLRTIKDQENQLLANQTTVTFDFNGAGMKHTAVAGLEFISEKQLTYGYDSKSLGDLPDANLYNPNPSAPFKTAPAPKRNSVYGEATTNTQALYLFDTAKLGEQWMFSGGVRADHYSTSYDAVVLTTASTSPGVPAGVFLPVKLDLADTLWTGKLSALYKPTENSSVYATVATSKQPPGGGTMALSISANSAANPKFDPQSTTTKEIGGKWDFLKQKLALAAAIYRTDVRNEIEQDPTDLQYYQTGKKRVDGVEISLTGEIARNWLISGGYAHMKTQVTSGKVMTAAGQNVLSYTPKDSFTVWTSYTLPMGLKLGGGANYVGKLLRGTDGAVGTPAYADAYWVVNAMAAYQVTRNIELQLNVNNLFDKEYIQAINKSGYRYTPGAPRSGSLTANIRF
jgi:catecholate siderophore receptor